MSAVISIRAGTAIRDQHVFDRAMAHARNYGWEKSEQIKFANRVRYGVRYGEDEAATIARVQREMIEREDPPSPRPAA